MWKPKQVVKAAKPMLVVCRLSDCLFHEGSLEHDAEVCRCSHPQRPNEPKQGSCSLYRVNFAAKIAAVTGTK